jgi:hypothetical protein
LGCCKYADENEEDANESSAENVNNEEEPEELDLEVTVGHVASRAWTSYTRQEILTFLLPFMAYFYVVLVPQVYAADRTRIQLLYSSVPAQLEGDFIFNVLLAVETFMIVYWMSTNWFCIFLKLSMFAKCEIALEELNERAR